MEGVFTIAKKKYFFSLSGNVVAWAGKKGAKKNDGECAIKPGSKVEACAGGFSFGPDSTGKMVQVEGEGAEEWVAALQKLTAGAAEAEEFLRKVKARVGGDGRVSDARTDRAGSRARRRSSSSRCRRAF